MPEMEKGNPDAMQDETLIQEVMRRDLGPILMAVGNRLKDLEEDLTETKDLLFKFTEGLIGAADNHKRMSLSSELSTKYGKDFEPFEGFYKDTQGKGFSDSILEELMNGDFDDEGRDGFIKGKLDEAKGKFGKYVGLEKKEEEAAPPMTEVAITEEKGESPAEQAGEEPAEEEPMDAVSKIHKELMSVAGKRNSLSGKK